jgi:hypothetical protein
LSAETVLAEYIGPSAKFVIDDIEFVAGKAVKVSQEIADRLAAVGREHAFAFTKSDAKTEPLAKETTPPQTPTATTADYSPTAQSSGLSEDDSTTPE